jgi:hypothetical protein
MKVVYEINTNHKFSSTVKKKLINTFLIIWLELNLNAYTLSSNSKNNVILYYIIFNTRIHELAQKGSFFGFLNK